MKVAYFDCSSGISGNMVVGSLLDAGFDQQSLARGIATLKLTGYGLDIRKIKKNSISCTYFNVTLADGRYKRSNLSDINKIIDNSPLETEVKELSKRIFAKLAKAEADAHGIPVTEVHFHEVGAIDAIIDIVGTSLGIKKLGIQKIISSPIPLGKGLIKSKHGDLPNPAPGTINCLKGIAVYGVEIDKEIVTPTGAAIISTLAEEFGILPAIKIEKVGYGAGKMDLAGPNYLRLYIGEETDNRQICDKIEANIDDMNPEMFENVFDKLFNGGALDVYTINIQMKRDRPATMLCVLCLPNKTHQLTNIIYQETTTTGLRVYQGLKYSLPKETKTINTKWGAVRVKIAYLDTKIVNVKPEYADCRKIADNSGMSLKEVYQQIFKKIYEEIPEVTQSAL